MTDGPIRDFPAQFREAGFAIGPRSCELLKKHLDIGENVILRVVDARSLISHNHYFAIIKNAFDTLPEDMAADFRTPEHLRKWALIKAGYCTTAVTVCRTVAEARRTIAFMRKVDEFSVAMHDRNVVTVWRAQSQSFEEMGRRAFQKSKDDVFNVLSDLLGVDVTTLKKQEAGDGG